MTRFAYNAELEAAIREDPDDDARWSVLEDWILEQDDERAQFVRLAKAGDRDGATRATWEIADAVGEGDRFSALYAATAGCHWRAGYVDHGYFEAPQSTRIGLLRRFLATRTTSLMRQLRITIDQPAELRALVDELVRAPCKHTLRRLIVAAYWKPPTQQVTFDARSLAPLLLDTLRFYDRAIRIDYADPLARLRQLAMAPGAAEDLSIFEPGRFPALRDLELDLRTLEARGWHRVDVLDGAFACPLARLRLRVSDAMFAQLRERIPSAIEVER